MSRQPIRLAALSILVVMAGCAAEAKKPEPEEISPAGAANTTEPSAVTEATPAAEVEPAVAEPASEPQLDLPVAAETEKPADAPAEAQAALPEPKAEKPAARPSAADGTPLIPRLVLFGNPDKASARLSHDGTKLSYLAPKDGVLNVFVGPVDKPDEAKPVTNDTQRGIRSYFWAYDNKHILYVQDSKGDEDWHVYSVDLESGETKDLTPMKGWPPRSKASARSSPKRSSSASTIATRSFTISIASTSPRASKELLEKNTEFAGYVVDDDFKVRFASKMMPDGSLQYLEPNGEGGWKDYINVGADDTLTTAIAGFDKTGQKLYLTDSRDRNTSALVEIDLADGEQKVLASNDKADLSGVDRASHGKEHSGGELRLHAARVAGSRSGDSRRPGLPEERRRRRAADCQPHAGRHEVDRGLRDGRWPGALLPATTGRTRRRTSCSPIASRSKASRWPRCTRW